MTVTDISREPQKPEVIRLAAYCRVSSKSADQLHSFAAQIRYYKDYERKNPQYKLVDVYADEGLSGTDMKKRDEQNRLIRDCKLGKIDRIITKSVSRFAQNTQELLVALRSLKEMGVSIYFEEQGIDSEKMNMEMLVTFPGMAAQQESVNISDHLRRSYQMRMESGEFNCNAPAYGFKIVDGQLVVKEDEAKVIRRIFDLYLQGVGKQNIANILNAESVPRRYGQQKWHHTTIDYVIKNEKYAGNAVLNKTYVVDCISKKIKRNDGKARPMYFVENNHPAIIAPATFSRAQEELARLKVKQKGTKTEQGRYSSKYALTELLVCGECGTPYRRCIWTVKGEKKPVWRCINRLDFGKKYCHHSPTMEERVLQEVIMTAIMRTAKESADVLGTLKLHIGMGLEANDTEDNSLDIQIRIAEIDAEFKAMLQAIATDTVEDFDGQRATELMNEKSALEHQLSQYGNAQQEKEKTESRLDELFTILEGGRESPHGIRRSASTTGAGMCGGRIQG